MTTLRSRRVVVTKLADGPLTHDNFRLEEHLLAEPAAGEAVVANLVMAVDPAMRVRLDAAAHRSFAFPVGAPPGGNAVGRVVRSRIAGVEEGTLVRSFTGWQEHAIVAAADLTPVTTIVGDRAPELALTALGNPGLTAWVGMVVIGTTAPGDVVLVSGAAGGIGSLAGQIARLRGGRVLIGAAGGAKVAVLVDDLGFDAAFDARSPDIGAALSAQAPRGVDVFFDNVGGELLTASLRHMRPHGRVVLCGAVSGYDEGVATTTPVALREAIGRRLTLRGYIVDDHRDRFEEAFAELQQWLDDGVLVAPATISEGLETVVDALLEVIRPSSPHVGKRLVRLAVDT